MLLIAWSVACLTVGILLLLTTSVYLNYGRDKSPKYLIAFFLCIACYALNSFFKWEILTLPENLSILNYFSIGPERAYQVHVGIWLFSFMVPWTAWLFLRSVCRETPEKFFCALPLICVMSLNLYSYYTHFSQLIFLHISNMINFFTLIFALYEVLHDIKLDLSNRRIAFRNATFLSLIVFILAIFLVEALNPPWEGSAWILATRILVLLCVVIVAVAYFQSPASALREIFNIVEEGIDIRPKVISRKAEELVTLMKVRELYKNPNLSVIMLAEKFGISEVKLRDLIKIELGFRNFNAFVNSFRIEHVVEQFMIESHLSIAGIMLEAGFKSHPPFNRAFRELYSVSPKEFREKLMLEKASNPSTPKVPAKHV